MNPSHPGERAGLSRSVGPLSEGRLMGLEETAASSLPLRELALSGPRRGERPLPSRIPGHLLSTDVF